MRKLVLSAVVLLAFAATALPNAAWDLGLPDGGQRVNFRGAGAFNQDAVGLEVDPDTTPDLIYGTGPNFLMFEPAPLERGTELFGIASINDIVAVPSTGTLWEPDPGKEMTLSFFNAFAVESIRSKPIPGNPYIVQIVTTYTDDARLLLVQDDSADYFPDPGPGQFGYNGAGTYPTVYTNGLDADEEVFLELRLNGGISYLLWDERLGPQGLLSASFDSMDVDIIGGVGADQFANILQGHGDVLQLSFGGADWLYNANVNVVATTVPAPTALLSLFSGLALLGGYRLRRRS